MRDLLLLREQYGSVYVLTLPDGKRIPYKLLSVGDFLKYEHLFKTGQYPSTYLENEIFTKCVVDNILVDHIDQLKAGIVTSVATVILGASGPSSIDDLNYYLNLNRETASFAIHEMVSVICQAFPAYKPDDLYKLEYELFMLRLAQAERHLMRIGVLQEPLSVTSPDMEGKLPEKPKVNADELFKEWEAQQRETGGYIPHPTQPQTPPPQQKSAETVISKTEMNKPGVHTSGGAWDAIDTPVEERQSKMVKETASIYNEYLDQMNEGQKVKVPSMEDRRAAALARAKVNEEAFNVSQELEKKKFNAEMKEALAEREKARAAKRRKKRH